MKLIVSTIQDQDAETTAHNLTEKGYRFTRIGSTGSFLRQGNTTLLVGVDSSTQPSFVLPDLKMSVLLMV